MTAKKTRVRISRLVVEAASDSEGREVARAIRSELERQAAGAGDGIRHGGGRVEAPGTSMVLPAGTPASEIGARVARSIVQTGRQAARSKESR